MCIALFNPPNNIQHGGCLLFFAFHKGIGMWRGNVTCSGLQSFSVKRKDSEFEVWSKLISLSCTKYLFWLTQTSPVSLRWRSFPYFQRDRSWAEVTCSSWTLARGKCLSSLKDYSLHPPVHSAPTPIWLFKNIDWVYFRSFFSSQEEKKSHSLYCRRGWKRGL